jgi:drug/metabolite transporter (DMT)-like permease
MKIFESYKSFFLILITAIAGAGVSVLSKYGLREIEPITFVFFRIVLALVVLLPVFYWQKEKLVFKNFVKLLPVSIFGAANIIVFIFGIKLTTASSAQIIYTLSPLLAGVISYFLLKERLGSKTKWGIIIGFIGALLIIILPVITGKSTVDGNIVGNLLVLISVCSHSLYSVFSKKQHDEFSAIAITVYFVITTFLIQLLLIVFTLSQDTSLFHLPSLPSILSLLYVGIIGTGGYYLLYQYSIRHSSPSIASTVLYLQPTFTIIWAVNLLNEKLTLGFIIGTILAFIGILLVTLPAKGKKIKKLLEIHETA